MKRTGDRFEYFKRGRLWHWQLYVAYSPSWYPVAISGRGYASEKLVRKAVLRTQGSASGAGDKIMRVDDSGYSMTIAKTAEGSLRVEGVNPCT